MGSGPPSMCLGCAKPVARTQTGLYYCGYISEVLYEKGYLDFSKNKGEGKTHMYVALVSRAEYTRRTMQDVKKNFFGGNLKSMFSYFVREEKLSPEEIQELLSAISEE